MGGKAGKKNKEEKVIFLSVKICNGKEGPTLTFSVPKIFLGVTTMRSMKTQFTFLLKTSPSNLLFGKFLEIRVTLFCPFKSLNIFPRYIQTKN